jgi:anaerobic selenocysteine-containing dehydrogenase
MKVHGACPHDCPDTCGVITEVVDGRAVNFYGDPDHPITQGWLCAKVRPYLDHVYHPDRLVNPTAAPRGAERERANGRRITWDEALAEIGARWRAIIAEHGAAAILPYSYSGTLGLAQMSVCNGRFWNRLGASRLERSICGAAAEFAVEATLGARHSQPYQDVIHSKPGHRLGAQSSHHRPPFHALFQGRTARTGRSWWSLTRAAPARRKGPIGTSPRKPATDGALALGDGPCHRRSPGCMTRRG